MDNENLNNSHAKIPSKPSSAGMNKEYKLAKQDSFSGLTDLMKAKSFLAAPKPQLQLPLANSMPHLANQHVTASSSLLLLTRPIQAAPSVAALSHEEQANTLTVLPPSVPKYRNQNVQQLELVYDQNQNSQRNDGIERLVHVPSLPYKEPSLESRRVLAPVSHGDPIEPATFVGPLKLALSTFDSVQEPLIRFKEHTLGAMENDSQALTAQVRYLQEKVSKFEYQIEALHSHDHDVWEQLGKLRFQNEVNRDQMSALCRSIGLKEIEIKNLQIDNGSLVTKLLEAENKFKNLGALKGELDYFGGVEKTIGEHSLTLNSMVPSKDAALQGFQPAIHRPDEQVQHVILEGNAASQAQGQIPEHMTEIQNLSDKLAHMKRIITELRQQNLRDQLKNSNLEDELQELRGKVNQENIEELGNSLKEKTNTCDRLRNELKITEKHLKVSQERVLRATNKGELLQGGAHLVVPSTSGKLPKRVIACTECYANNIACDSNARCRSCTERGMKCTRWMCSLKARLGHCHMAPCKLLHDSQGWLILEDSRPQW
ncbi:hypothetical protein BKA66DRAFT_447665 [Pyrenochaeta sp. MPI-SDFR-AT-0127]|nr:hypothetical protein BKA66DRAFT_447665 [Pyrenochaeta sp. MPI-SDFR-AT-0127]